MNAEKTTKPLYETFIHFFAMAIFGIDVILRLFAMGPRKYFFSGLCLVDFILSILDIVELVFHETAGPKSLGRLFRLARFAKLFRLRKLPALDAWASAEKLEKMTSAGIRESGVSPTEKVRSRDKRSDELEKAC